jgi:outer membrane protein OmpA-like peptidoglycan-associated protein
MSEIRFYRWTISFRQILTIAVIGSLLIHIILIVGFKSIGLHFGKPLVDPISPKKMTLKQSNIDPNFFQNQTQPDVPKLEQRIASAPLDFKQGQTAAFSGPLEAPKMSTPLVTQEVPLPLSVSNVQMPKEAFSAVKIEDSGKVPQLSEAMIKDASTAALSEVNNIVLRGALAGGRDESIQASGDAGNVPDFKEISSMIKKEKADDNVQPRPGRQPILIRLSSDLLFAFDSTVLNKTAGGKLQRVAQFIKQGKNSSILIEGYTDTFGTEQYNDNLSEARAQSVANWFIQNAGLNQKKITVFGHGEREPLVNPNGTIEEQAPNRRVEIKIEVQKD